MFHRILITIRRRIRLNRFVQLGLLSFFWFAGQNIARWTDTSLPGGLIGMAMVLALLLSRKISPQSLKGGANLFLADMLLFFVPAIVAIVDHHELFSLLGLKVFGVIVLGTLTVMLMTALTIELCERFSRSMAAMEARHAH